jgi:hypothetical protein
MELIRAIEMRSRRKAKAWIKKYPQELASSCADATFSIAADLIHGGDLFTLPLNGREADRGFLEYLYWNRYLEPLAGAIEKANAGDFSAFRRVARVFEQYERLRTGQGQIKGFRIHQEHHFLFELGIDMGLNKLGGEELATFFDTYCPCGENPHDADALKKERSRVVQQLQRAVSSHQEQLAKIPPREHFAVFGKDDLYAKSLRLADTGIPLVAVGKLGCQAECYVNEKGELFRVSRSRIRRPAAAFGFRSATELFAMFFPKVSAKTKAASGSR